MSSGRPAGLLLDGAAPAPPTATEETTVRTIFVHLPVTDLGRAKAFYAALGFVNNQQFSDETAADMVVEEDVWVMLLIRQKFASFVTG